MELKISHQFEGKIMNCGKLNLTLQNVKMATEETTKKVIVTFALNEVSNNSSITRIAELPVILDITSQNQIEIDPCIRRAISLIKDQFADLVDNGLQNTATITI